jgi:glutaconate CoA-transferase subunit A
VRLLLEAELQDKVMGLDEAIKKFMFDGCTLSLGCLPRSFAGIYEIIRQKKRGIQLVGLGFLEESDLLVGAGCVNKMQAGFFASLETYGLSKTFRRAAEKGIPNKVDVEEYSNFAMLMRFVGGALGVPFMPVKSLLGTDIVNKKTFLGDKKLQVTECPFSKEKVVLVPSIKPDVCILHAQRADTSGNVQMWGINFGGPWEAYASKKVIVTVEEVVSREDIGRDPARTSIPSFMANAVVYAPFGAHPWNCVGHYDIDFEHRTMYAKKESDQSTFEQYLDEWVYGCPTQLDYVKKLGVERLLNLKCKPKYSTPINYGYQTEMNP